MLWFDRHRRLRDQLSAYIDGALDSPAVERVEAHLAGCERCRAELEELHATVAALRELPQADLPRSFVLSPEQVEARRSPQPAIPLAFGMRMATAGVAVALAAVLMADLGDFGGGGVPQEAAAPGITAERLADETEMGMQGAAPAPGAEEEPSAADTSSKYDADADEAEGEPSTEADEEMTGMAPSPVPTLPTDATVVPRGEEGALFPSGLTPEPEAGIVDAAPQAEGGDGGIDALTAAEIGLAAALGALVAGSLALAFAGRKR